ncbi:MAG: LysR family transcriptional regulator [Ruminococcaceae bacterium]|nr:LysR family transcriptional regulator [Oscillospiraceae bacterium]
MNQQNIRIFMAVVENGSIAEAARVLHYTHPRVSESIRQLESELGVQLLLRGRGIRKVGLTPEGQRFIPVAMQWTAADRQIKRYIQDEQEPAFRLNGWGDMIEYMFPDIVQGMRREIPNLQVRLLNGAKKTVVEMMDRQAFDAAIWPGNPFEHAQAVWIPFFDEERCILCPVDTPLPDRPILPAELDGRYEIRYSWIATTDPVEPSPWRREYFPDRVTPRIRVEAMMAIHSYMDDRNCWSIVPERIARWSMERRPGRLTIRRLDPAPPMQKSWILTSKSQLGTPVFQCFLRYCDAYLDETPYLHKTLVL